MKALDQDVNGESEKELLRPANSDDDLDEVQRCIKHNKKLMEVQSRPDYKDRVLDTIANCFDMNNPAAGWQQKQRRKALQK